MDEQAPPDRKLTEYERLVLQRHHYMIVGDVDKPFHLPECSCPECEQWRTSKGRPTFQVLRHLG